MTSRVAGAAWSHMPQNVLGALKPSSELRARTAPVDSAASEGSYWFDAEMLADAASDAPSNTSNDTEVSAANAVVPAASYAATTATNDDSSTPGGFSLIIELIEAELPIYDVVLHLPAASAARLAKTCRVARKLLLQPDMAQWCAESRIAALERVAQAGDLSLAPKKCEWTLERLHLCEEPPRFPRIYFKFADHQLDEASLCKVDAVAKMLTKHPKLRLRVHGYAQPNAPDVIGEALAQSRAVTVRNHLLSRLRHVAEWSGERAEHDVHELEWLSYTSTSMHRTKLVGDKLQAIGRWGRVPTNTNFSHGDGWGAGFATSTVETQNVNEVLQGLAAVGGYSDSDNDSESESDSDDESGSEGADDGNEGNGPHHHADADADADGDVDAGSDVGASEDDDEEWDSDSQSAADDEYCGRDKMRRAEFTLLGLD